MNDEKISNFAQSDMTTYSLTLVKGKVDITYRNVTLFENLAIYLTYLNKIYQYGNFSNIPIQITPKAEIALDLSVLIIDDNELVKLDIYSIIVNYRLLMKGLQAMTQLVTYNLNRSIANCRFIGYFFLLLLLGTHLILLFICLYIIGIFKQLMIKHCDVLIEIINNKSFIDFYSEKLNHLLTLSSFYKESAHTVISSYEKELAKFKTTTKIEKKKTQKSKIIKKRILKKTLLLGILML